MLPREFLREHAERLLTEMPERFAGSPLAHWSELDRKRREVVARLEEKRRRRNELTAGKGKPSPEALEEMKALKEEIRAMEEEAERADLELDAAEWKIPNAPQDSVPRGKDETQNKVERTWGEPPRFSFEPRAHWDLGPALGILDFEAGVRLAGARFTVLRGAGARLARALQNFFLDLHTREHGYTEILPPVLANRESLRGTGQLPKFEEDLFATTAGYYLIPTAEVPLTNLHREEILSDDALPIRYTGHTSCFRAEAGAAGRDTRGMIRNHQFDKVEIVQMVRPEDSNQALEELTAHAEKVLQKLGLPY
ncbi:MAG TPA: serine--tRNA ligase, partial [Thermoanaerobaculia bacterium]